MVGEWLGGMVLIAFFYSMVTVAMMMVDAEGLNYDHFAPDPWLVRYPKPGEMRGVYWCRQFVRASAWLPMSLAGLARMAVRFGRGFPSWFTERLDGSREADDD